MKYYSKALLYSLLLHLSIALFLFFSPQNNHLSKQYALKKSEPTQKKEIIHAAAIDSVQIDNEIKRIKTIAHQKKVEEQKQKKALLQQLTQAKQQRIKEEQALKSLKLEQEILLKKQQAAILKQRKKMMALKKARLAERQRLLQSRTKRKALDKKLALEKKRRIEKKRLQQEKAQAKRLEEEKKLAEIKAQQDKEKQQQINAEVNQYKSLLINAISQNWILPSNVNYALSCRFEIKLAPSGDVLNVTLLKTSGDPVLDRSAQTAIYNASPLPVPKTPEAFEIFKVVSLTVKPENTH